MKKKTYVKPVLNSEEFVPQEYIATCKDEPTSYLFTCDAPAGDIYYYRNSNPFEPMPPASARATELGSYVPCSDQHVIKVDERRSNVYWGFVDRPKPGDWYGNGKRDKGEEALIWVEKGWFGIPKNWHATTELDINSWTKNMS